MADLESNIDDIEQWIDGIVSAVDFTRPGKDQSLGRDLAGIVAEEIQVRTAGNSQSADGSPLKDNEPRYAAYKARKYNVHQALVRTGQLLSLQSLIGETTITSDEVSMRYGVGEAPKSGSTGYISDADKKVTDREKAEYVSDERPFYGLDERIADEVAKAAGEWLAEQDFS
jgi:hypothetical protein